MDVYKYNQIEQQMLDAEPGVAVAALAAARVQVETAEWHLQRIVELGARLNARRDEFDAVAEGSDPGQIEAGRQVIDDPAVDEALATVERARTALAELAKWEKRGHG